MENLGADDLRRLYAIWRALQLYHRVSQIGQFPRTYIELALLSPSRLLTLAGFSMAMLATNPSPEGIGVAIVLLLFASIAAFFTGFRSRRNHQSPLRALFNRALPSMDKSKAGTAGREILDAIGLRRKVIFRMAPDDQVVVASRLGIVVVYLPPGAKALLKGTKERYVFLLAHESAHVLQGDSLWMELAVRTTRDSVLHERILKVIIILVSLAICMVWPCAFVWTLTCSDTVDRIQNSPNRFMTLIRAEHLADLHAAYWTLKLTGGLQASTLREMTKTPPDGGDFHPDPEHRFQFIGDCMALARSGHVEPFLEKWEFVVGPPQRSWLHWLIAALLSPCILCCPGAPLGIKEPYNVGFIVFYLAVTALVSLIPVIWLGRDLAGRLTRWRLRKLHLRP